MLFGGPKLQMQLKKGSDGEEADVFPSGSCMQGVCKAQIWTALGQLLPSFLLRYGRGTQLRALTVSSSRTLPVSAEPEF